MFRYPAFIALTLLLSNCSFMQPTTVPTLGEVSSNYTYVPLDGLPVNQLTGADSCVENGSTQFKPLLSALPDISIRFAVSQLSNNASGGFGPVAVTTEGSNYKAILDYVNNDSVPVSLYIRKLAQTQGKTGTTPLSLSEKLAPDQTLAAYDVILYAMNNKPIANPLNDDTKTDANELKNLLTQKYESVTIPVYVGLGLRITADVFAQKGGIEISGLGNIGADGLAGGLTMQTIGVTGPIVSNLLPIPRNIDQTTIENTLLALGSARTLVYTNANDPSKVKLTPRVVGLYSPIGSDPALINAIYSELARERLQWNRPCVNANKDQ